MATDPKKSEGARYERKAMRAYLQRKLSRGVTIDQAITLTVVFDWVKSRQSRYDKQQGGL